MTFDRDSSKGVLFKLVVVAAVIVPCLSVCSSGQDSKPVVVNIHLDQPTDRYLPIWNFFGADEPNYTYAPNGQKLLRELGELGPANEPVPAYFRLHNLLTSGDGEASLKWGSTNAYTEGSDGQPKYDWAITDRIFDSLMAAHLRPIVEIGFMPEALSTHPKPYRHTFPKGDIYTGWAYPPKDYDKWARLVQVYADHLKSRYGTKVDQWLWEVWNEPDIGYWQASPEEYNRLYDVTANSILTVLPHALTGGPESTGVTSKRSEAFLRQFLEHCAHGVNAATGKAGAPLSFISYHPKGRPISVADGNGTHVRMDMGHQLRAIDRGMRVIASYPEWKRTPIILGESDPEGCAACQGPANQYRNGPLYGVSVAEATMRTYELARKYGLTVEGSVTWAFEFENQPYFAGFRELATNGVDKPVLNVFRMMGMLSGNWMQVESSGAMSLEDIAQESATGSSDINAVATSTAKEATVLVWNYNDEDLPVKDAAIEIHLSGLQMSSLTAEEFRMDKDHSNSYSVWQKMGSPTLPDSEQMKRLESAEGLERVQAAHTLLVANGVALVDLKLPRQGCRRDPFEMVRESFSHSFDGRPEGPWSGILRCSPLYIG